MLYKPKNFIAGGRTFHESMTGYSAAPCQAQLILARLVQASVLSSQTSWGLADLGELWHAQLGFPYTIFSLPDQACSHGGQVQAEEQQGIQNIFRPLPVSSRSCLLANSKAPGRPRISGKSREIVRESEIWERLVYSNLIGVKIF